MFKDFDIRPCIVDCGTTDGRAVDEVLWGHTGEQLSDRKRGGDRIKIEEDGAANLFTVDEVMKKQKPANVNSLRSFRNKLNRAIR